jgi:hypothetical protein
MIRFFPYLLNSLSPSRSETLKQTMDKRYLFYICVFSAGVLSRERRPSRHGPLELFGSCYQFPPYAVFSRLWTSALIGVLCSAPLFSVQQLYLIKSGSKPRPSVYGYVFFIYLIIYTTVKSSGLKWMGFYCIYHRYSTNIIFMSNFRI